MNDDGSKHGDDGAIDIQRYLQVVFKRKWLILATIAVGITATVLYTARQTKIYAATASIVVEPHAPRVFGSDVQEVVSLGTGNYWSNKEYYNTLIGIIRSYDLARKTVLHERLKATQKLAYNDPRLLGSEGAQLPKDQRVTMATELLFGSMDASLGDDTRIVSIEVAHPDPTLARDLANAHVETFKRANLATRRTDTTKAKDFLASKRDKAATAMRDAVEKLSAYKQENNLVSVSLEDTANQVAADLRRYSTALADARIRRIELAAKRTRARKALDGDVLDSPIFGITNGSSAASALKVQYIEAQQEFAKLSQKLGEKHPDYISQKAKVGELYKQIEREARLSMTEIDEKYLAAVETEKKFAGEVNRMKKKAVELDPMKVEVERLEREVKTAARNYEDVRKQHRASDLSSQNPLGNIRPHDVARTPDRPIYPNLKKNIAIAFALSLMLGLGLAFAFEYMDRTIKSTADVELATRSPVLGMIPVLNEVPTTTEALQERDLYVFRNPTSRAAECARSIRTNILFSSADKKLQLLTVSSPNPREGKTTSVMYLGTTMAQSGQKVLLVDTDLRRARLHKSVGVARGKGVTSLLVGEADYDDAIKTTEIPNLYVLPCGPTPPNPAELLLTNRFMEIMDELRTRFDWILLDSPPIGAVTDAVVLARLSDGVILVAQAERTHRDELARARKQLADVNANVVGVILNDLDISDKKGGYYYYAYNSGEDEAEAAG